MPVRSATALASGVASAALTFSVSCCTTAGGVPAGANRPTQASTSKPARPASAVVGTLGRPGWRVLPVTA